MKQALTSDSAQILALWRELTDELRGVLDAHGVCATVANKVAVLTGTVTVVGLRSQVPDHVDVWLGNPDGQLEQARWPIVKASMTPFFRADGPVLHRKEDVLAGERLTSELWQRVVDHVLAVPLPYRPSHPDITPQGALCLLDPEPGSFVDPDILLSLAIHATTHLDRAFLSQREMQQDIEFQIVSEINYSLTSTLSLERIYNELSDPVRRVLNVESVSIGLTEQPSGEIVFLTPLMGPLFQDLPPIRLRPGEGIAGWVAQHAQPVIVNNVYADKRFYARADRISGFQTHSMLCVPLRVEHKVIGVVQAINKRSGEFNEHDLRLMQAISSPLAAAITNASLHTDVLAEKQRIQSIFASMSEGLLTSDVNGRITAVNDALLALLHRDHDDLVGQIASEVIRLRKNDLKQFINRVSQSPRDSHLQLACEVYQGPDEYVPVLLSGAPIESEEGGVSEIIVVFSDLSQIREVERMRDDFFHNIVHEFRTPLSAILMYARLLREGKADDPEKVDRFLGVIERESDRLQMMVRQTLQLAKLGAREIQRSPELINVNALLDEIIPPLADQAMQKGLTFSQRIAPDLPSINGNRETMYVIFKNLIENAVKFSLTGTVLITAVRHGNELVVTVKDDGIGIPEAALPNLFKRFYRARTAVERGIAGTGLGLYMVKDGVDKHQGTLDVTSAEGDGTTFTVRLPIHEP